jgi:hypothetical protein
MQRPLGVKGVGEHMWTLGELWKNFGRYEKLFFFAIGLMKTQVCSEFAKKFLFERSLYL